MTAAADIKSWLQRCTFLKAELLESESFVQLVDQRMRHQGLSDPADYLRLLQHSSMELECMVEGVAVQESWLFRYPASFEVLADHLRQLRLRRGPGGFLHMISVGCADGQEPASMAITALHAGWSGDKVLIHALDFNAGAIDRAHAGLYSPRALRPDRPDWADTWLHQRDDQVQIDAAALQLIRYDHADALTAAALNGAREADALFCRNVLIYLHDQARSALLQRFGAAMVLGGLLFLGHAESSCPDDLFEPLGVPHAFSWQRNVSRKRPSAAAHHPRESAAKRAPPPIAALSGDRPTSTRRTTEPAKRAALPSEDQRGSAELAPTAPDPAQVALVRARELANHGELQAARESAEALLANHGPRPDGLELLGSIYLALGAVDHAQSCFRKAVYLDPQREAARLQLELLESMSPAPGAGHPSSTNNQSGTPPP